MPQHAMPSGTTGKTEALPELEDTVVAFHLAVLAGRSRPSADTDIYT